MTTALRVRLSNKSTMPLYIWFQPVPGLAVHHNIKWSIKEEGFIVTPEWTVSHIPSEQIILPDVVGVSTKAHAELICDLLAPLGDWTQPTPPPMDKDIFAEILRAGGSPGMGKEASDAPEPSPRFVIEPIEGGLGYSVVDTNTGHVMEDTFYHRGLAAQAAADLNNQKG